MAGNTESPPKPGTLRVQRHRANKTAGRLWVPGFWLDENDTELLANRGVVNDWSGETENAKAVSTLARMNLRKLLRS